MNKEELNELLLNAKWKTSSSKKYEKLPHQYSLKETWTDENLFYKVCKAIRALGIKKPFFRTFFTYYEIGEYQYFIMNDEIENQGLINRAEIKNQKKYNLNNYGN